MTRQTSIDGTPHPPTAVSSPATHRFARRPGLLALVLVIVTGVWAYHNSFQGPFHL